METELWLTVNYDFMQFSQDFFEWLLRSSDFSFHELSRTYSQLMEELQEC